LVSMSWPPMKPFVWHVRVEVLTRMSLASRDNNVPNLSLTVPPKVGEPTLSSTPASINAAPG
jgi:hypothetical protein